MRYDVLEAKEYANMGKIEEWIHSFLCSVGDNQGLSDGLKLQKRYYLGPIEVPLHCINRCCGPEEGMEYYNDRDSWEIEIEKFRNLIRNGWEMPPLIVSNTDGFLSIRDGNHRHEALVRENHKTCWIIIWDNDSMENLLKLNF